MQRYDKPRPELSRSCLPLPQVSRQPPIDAIIREFCSKSAGQKPTGGMQPVQRVKKGEAQVDLESVDFPVLAWLKSQTIRLADNPDALHLPYTEKFGEDFYTIYEEDISVINAAYNTKSGDNDAVLYEGMLGKADEKHSVIYPGLNSCIGVTVTDSRTADMTAAHFAVPTNSKSLATYKENLEQLLTTMRAIEVEYCRVTVSSDAATKLDNHVEDIAAWNREGMYGVDNADVKVVIDGLKELEAYPNKRIDSRDGSSDESTKAKYGTNYIHSVKDKKMPFPPLFIGMGSPRVSIKYSPMDESLPEESKSFHITSDTYRAIATIAEDCNIEEVIVQQDLIPVFKQNIPYHSLEQLKAVLQSVKGVRSYAATRIAEYIYDAYVE